MNYELTMNYELRRKRRRRKRKRRRRGKRRRNETKTSYWPVKQFHNLMRPDGWPVASTNRSSPLWRLNTDLLLMGLTPKAIECTSSLVSIMWYSLPHNPSMSLGSCLKIRDISFIHYFVEGHVFMWGCVVEWFKTPSTAGGLYHPDSSLIQATG